jgi:hypothetical protein
VTAIDGATLCLPRFKVEAATAMAGREPFLPDILTTVFPEFGARSAENIRDLYLSVLSIDA